MGLWRLVLDFNINLSHSVWFRSKWVCLLWTRIVTDYRLFRLRADNRIIDCLDISVGSDEEAILEAVRVDHAYIIEVWQLARLVARVDPKSPFS
jgi:hypothetical protein